MVKVKSKSFSWKPVEIDGNLFTDGGCDGLVGIEELTDYELTDGNQIIDESTSLKLKNIKIKKKKAKLKRKPKVVTSPNKFTVTPSKNEENDVVNMEIPSDESTPETLKKIPEESFYPWSNIHVPKIIAKSLLEEGFFEPTQIQAICIPPALKGRKDILGAAETGSGKTLAFGIPILYGIMKQQEKSQNQDNDQLSDSEEDCDDPDVDGIGCVKVVNLGPVSRKGEGGQCQPLALVLTPTRELAMQINKHLLVAARYTGIKVAVLVGGMSVDKQKRLLRRMPEIIVATPGRLWELVRIGEVSASNVRFLAIDEADRMTEVNHFPELRSLLELLNTDETSCKTRQNFIFSATLTLVHDLPKHVKKKLEKKKKKSESDGTQAGKLSKLVELVGAKAVKVVDLTRREAVAQTLTETRILCASPEDKDVQLYLFLRRNPARTVVFCNSISCVRRLASLLTILRCHPLPLHASMPQRQRLKNLDRFRDGPESVLLATDVAARGLDIPNVAHVAHFQVPRTAEAYVHRSGRTARANRSGLTVLFMEPTEVDVYKRLCKTLGREKDIAEFPVESDLLPAAKERVRLARDLERFEMRVKRDQAKIGWLEKAARDMDLLVDEELMPHKANSQHDSATERALAVKRKHLDELLKIPIRPKINNLRYPLLNQT